MSDLVIDKVYSHRMSIDRHRMSLLRPGVIKQHIGQTRIDVYKALRSTLPLAIPVS